MNSNKEYFDYSLKNPDALIDFSKPEGMIVINRDASEKETGLVQANEKLIDLIATYKTIRDDNSFSEQSKNSIINQIIDIVENTKLINYSPFCAYFQVLGYPYSSYMGDKDNESLNEKIGLMRNIVDCYIDNRHDMYNFHGYSNQSLQVMADSASSRRNGVTGIKKITSYLDDNGFIHAKNFGEFSRHSECYLLPDKGDKEAFITVLSMNDIKFDFQQKRQNKFPDLMIKIHHDIYIVEQKITNGSGGAQNEAINEIIDFAKGQENSRCIHYVSCLQGNYFTRLSQIYDNKTPKAKANKEQHQLDDIRNLLNDCFSNYFVNENGLEKLLSDLVEEYGCR